MKIPAFNDKSKLHSWLYENKALLINQKKASVKYADAPVINIAGGFEVASKAGNPDLQQADAIKVVPIINTTKLYDSHGDVHFDGLWDKSIKESKSNYLVKEHNFAFDGVVSDNVKVYTKNYTWKDLGFDYEGNTQALVYESIIDKNDPTGMFARYAAGKVKQHSVGMRYIKLALAMDNDRYPAEMKTWKDYYDKIANKADVDEAGWFWAVTEAKNIEGSAVMRGSNFATPTYSVSDADAEEPEDKSTRKPLYALNLGQSAAGGTKSIYQLKI